MPSSSGGGSISPGQRNSVSKAGSSASGSRKSPGDWTLVTREHKRSHPSSPVSPTQKSTSTCQSTTKLPKSASTSTTQADNNNSFSLDDSGSVISFERTTSTDLPPVNTATSPQPVVQAFSKNNISRSNDTAGLIYTDNYNGPIIVLAECVDQNKNADPYSDPYTQPPVTLPIIRGPFDTPITRGPYGDPYEQPPVTLPITRGPFDTPITRGPYGDPYAQPPVTLPITRGPFDNPITRGPYSDPYAQPPVTLPITRDPFDNPITRGPYDNPITRGTHGPPQDFYNYNRETFYDPNRGRHLHLHHYHHHHHY